MERDNMTDFNFASGLTPPHQGSPYYNPPNLQFTRYSYLRLSYFTMVVFGLLFPLSLLLSVPAVMMSRKVRSP